jgi:phenylacetaldehyde dehydrogenase
MTVIAKPDYLLRDDVQKFIDRPKKLFINGQWHDSIKGETLEVYDPAVGTKICTVAAGDAEDVDRAVAAARHAFDEGPWSKLNPSERGRLVWRLADLLEEHADEFAQIDALDNGKPVTDARAVDVAFSIELLRYMAGWSNKIYGETIPLTNPADFHAYTLREPVGVVGQIVPWNSPS